MSKAPPKMENGARRPGQSIRNDRVCRHVGRRIAARRSELKISQTAFGAALSGMTQQGVSRIEKGGETNYSTLFEIAELLEVDIGFFFEGLEQQVGMLAVAGGRETFQAAKDGMVRIDGVNGFRGVDSDSSGFFSRKDPNLSPISSPLLRRAFETWRNGDLEGQRICANEVWDASVVVTRTPGDIQTYAHVGQDSAILQVKGRDFAAELIGKPRRPTTPFLQMVGEIYSAVFDDMEPRYDHVLAPIGPDPDNIRWIPYHRLLLPWQDFSGSSIICLSDVRAVDMPFLNAGDLTGDD